MSTDTPITSVPISKIIQIWDGWKIVVIEIHKILYGSKNTNSLMNYTYFHLTNSKFHMFVVQIVLN